MGKQTMKQLKSMLCKELDEFAQMGELSVGSLETIHKLTDTIKNIDKIDTLEDSSRDGGWRAEGMFSRSRDSYRNDSYRDGSYRYSMNEYSRGKDDLTDEMRNYMNSRAISNEDKELLERAMRIMSEK